ncbi:MAG: CPBP family intramembrane glutamic endopeptidase [Deltaproteobacteria bacterium]
MTEARPLRPGRTEWLAFFALALIFFCAWFKLGYSQFSAVDLSVGKSTALRTAQDFLARRNVPYRTYLTSVIFDSDQWADTYLQQTMGLAKEEQFAREQNYEMFRWRVRFFRQFEPEEYVFEISPRTGAIIAFHHKIPDVEQRPAVSKEAASAAALGSLKDMGLDFSAYDFHEEKAKRYDNRTDYSFYWQKKGVNIPWKGGKGTAKILSGATVSGPEVLAFSVNELDLPQSFYRYTERQMYFGAYISSFSQLIFALLIILASVAIFNRKSTFITRVVRKRLLYAAGLLIIVNFLSLFNELQSAMSDYPTSTSLGSYLGIYFLQSLLGLFFTGFFFAVPAFVGESMQEEVDPAAHGRSISHYVLSSFWVRSFSRTVLLGYLFFFILLGMQAVIFFFGQKYLGVWKQWIKLTQFSSSYLPFFGAFAIGITASLTEESVFRMFAIPWGRKVFRNVIAAVVFTSLAWGFGHTQYAIFPVWFRGIEVTLIGLAYGYVFLRYGVIPLIIAHYLFDVFWGVSPYILGKSSPSLLAGSLFVLALPAALGLIAFLKNRPEEEKQPEMLFTSTQKFDLEVLGSFVRERLSEGEAPGRIREEALRNNWDVTVVDAALRQNGEKKG